MALTDYIIMPGADYQAACDKLREKSGKTGLIKSGDFASEIEVVAGEKLPEAESAYFGGVEVEERYSVQGDSLTGIAEQVQRLFDTEEAMTPEEMKLNLMNVASASELPSAEEAIFGIDSQGSEYGVQTEGDVFERTEYTSRTFGYAFTAREAFSIVGFRHKQNNDGRNKKIALWDNSGAAVRSMSVTDDASDWIDYYFDEPVNVAAGETYTVSVWTYNPSHMRFNSTVFNPKLMNTAIRYHDFDAYPANNSGGYFYFAFVDIIIKPVQAELPKNYQIARTTLDDIAIEAQRITGATDKLTTAQIVTALQGIATPAAE